MIQQIRDICSGCGTLQLIQNKKYYLCPDCVFKKNHGGKSKEEVYKERHEKKESKKHPIAKPNKVNNGGVVEELKKVFSIKKISSKRAKRHSELKEVYKKIDSERQPICEGCGRGDLPLSHSHILSEYDRPDLYTDPDNIRLHCFGSYNSCHEKIERRLAHEIVLMQDFKENLSYIKEKDKGEYNKIIASIEFEIEHNLEGKLPCNFDHNGECLLCDCWPSGCVYRTYKDI